MSDGEFFFLSDVANDSDCALYDSDEDASQILRLRSRSNFAAENFETWNETRLI